MFYFDATKAPQIGRELRTHRLEPGKSGFDHTNRRSPPDPRYQHANFAGEYGSNAARSTGLRRSSALSVFMTLGQMPKAVKASSLLRRSRRAWAMLAQPARRGVLVARFRRLAMARSLYWF